MAHVTVTGILTAGEKINERSDFIRQLKALLEATIRESDRGSFDHFMANHVQICLSMFERDYDNAAVMD